MGQVSRKYGDRASERSETVAVSPDLFLAQPQLFYTPDGKPRSGFDGKLLQVEQETPAQVFKSYESDLKQAGFQIVPLAGYGGGSLYEVKQGTIVYYLNLLPTPDQSGTLVVIWNIRPNANGN